MRYLTSIGVWLALWWLLSLSFDLGKMLLPDFSGTIGAAGHLIGDRTFLSNLGSTFLRIAPGALASIALGVPFGIFLATSRWARSLFEPLLDFVRGVPVATLFPVVIVLFGIGEPARVLLATYVSLPILATSALAGALERPENIGRRQYLQIHRDHAPRWHAVACLLWDAAPSILGGTKIALSLSLVVIVVSEMFFVGGSGIGWYAWDQYQSFRFHNMYAAILIIGTISTVVNVIFDLISGALSNRNGQGLQKR